ncbi:MAG: hypothetical protein ACOCXG_01995 [Nanoarchaeota archaeon]
MEKVEYITKDFNSSDDLNSLAKLFEGLVGKNSNPELLLRYVLRNSNSVIREGVSFSVGDYVHHTSEEDLILRHPNETTRIQKKHEADLRKKIQAYAQVKENFGIAPHVEIVANSFLDTIKALSGKTTSFGEENVLRTLERNYDLSYLSMSKGIHSLVYNGEKLRFSTDSMYESWDNTRNCHFEGGGLESSIERFIVGFDFERIIQEEEIFI